MTQHLRDAECPDRPFSQPHAHEILAESVPVVGCNRSQPTDELVVHFLVRVDRGDVEPRSLPIPDVLPCDDEGAPPILDDHVPLRFSGHEQARVRLVVVRVNAHAVDDKLLLLRLDVDQQLRLQRRRVRRENLPPFDRRRSVDALEFDEELLFRRPHDLDHLGTAVDEPQRSFLLVLGGKARHQDQGDEKGEGSPTPGGERSEPPPRPRARGLCFGVTGKWEWRRLHGATPRLPGTSHF